MSLDTIYLLKALLHHFSEHERKSIVKHLFFLQNFAVVCFLSMSLFGSIFARISVDGFTKSRSSTFCWPLLFSAFGHGIYQMAYTVFTWCTFLMCREHSLLYSVFWKDTYSGVYRYWKLLLCYVCLATVFNYVRTIFKPAGLLVHFLAGISKKL